jgi:hypothetical protein
MWYNKLKRLTFEEVKKLPIKERVTYLSEFSWGVLFQHFKSATDTILEYSEPFLKPDDMLLFYDALTIKLDFTKALGAKKEEDHKFILDSLEMVVQQFLIRKTIDSRWIDYEKNALKLRGKEAENEAGKLIELITKLKIASRDLEERDLSFKKEYLKLHTIVYRTDKRPTEFDYMLLISTLKTSVCMDLLKRYQGLFDGLNTFRSFPLTAKTEPTEKQSNTNETTLRKHALLLYYKGIKVTRTNANKHLPNGMISASNLFKHYDKFLEQNARTGSCLSSREFKSLKRVCESVIKELEGDALRTAEQELQLLKQNNKHW